MLDSKNREPNLPLKCIVLKIFFLDNKYPID